jgi:hypothetical protein
MVHFAIAKDSYHALITNWSPDNPFLNLLAAIHNAPMDQQLTMLEEMKSVTDVHIRSERLEIPPPMTECPPAPAPVITPVAPAAESPPAENPPAEDVNQGTLALRQTVTEIQRAYEALLLVNTTLQMDLEEEVDEHANSQRDMQMERDRADQADMVLQTHLKHKQPYGTSKQGGRVVPTPPVEQNPTGMPIPHKYISDKTSPKPTPAVPLKTPAPKIGLSTATTMRSTPATLEEASISPRP